MKRVISVLFVLCCILSSAHAAGFVTPKYPAEKEKHEQFWKYMTCQLAPELKEMYQEKWSAQRCRLVADKMEKDGFMIDDQCRDMLYRQKREHRWHATEALALLCESQLGPQWQWSMSDRYWLQRTKQMAGMPFENDAMPGPENPSIEDVVTYQYGLTSEQLNSYDYGVHLNLILDQMLWTVNVYPDLAQEPFKNDFCMEYYWPSKTYDIIDWRGR